jgi:uncharacterized protein
MRSILEANLPNTRFEDEPVPARAGIGLKHGHLAAILADPPDIGFLEVHAENYMGAGGAPHAQLAAIRERYALSVHGVGMSIGGDAGIDAAHLARFRAVVERYRPGLVSEHLAWSTHDGVYYNDLLPAPYTDATLARVVDHVGQLQDAIGRQILIENPSTYVLFAESTWNEADFMAAIAERSGCALLLDVNNVYVSATNHGYGAGEYIDSYPLELVREIHLAGHAPDSDELGRPLLIDSHDREVCGDVWSLFRLVLERTGPLPSLIEWDNDVPELEVLLREARLADAIMARGMISASPAHSGKAAAERKMA